MLRIRLHRVKLRLKYSKLGIKFRSKMRCIKARLITLNLFGLEKGFRDIDELISAITYVNRMAKTLPRVFEELYRYRVDGCNVFGDKEDLYELKTELIHELLRKYRDEVEVGYLIGGTDRLIMPYDLSQDMIVYHKVNWDRVNEIASKLLRGNLEENCKLNDYYGLIEIRYGNHRLHDIAGNLCYHASLIKRFDYIALRWQHHPLYASRNNILDVNGIHDLLVFMYYVYKARYIPIAKEIYWSMMRYALEYPHASLIGLVLRKLNYL